MIPNSLGELLEVAALHERPRVLLGVERIAADLRKQCLLPLGGERGPVE